MLGIEVVARGASSLQLSMPRNCNRTFVSCCSRHAVIGFYDALGRRLSLTRGARDAFLRTALGTIGSLFSALAGRHDDADVICRTRRTVNHPHPAMQPQ